MFWLLQIGGWTAYGIFLILNTIPFADDPGTVSYRVTLTASCFAGTFILHAACRRQWRRGFRSLKSLLIVLSCCTALTLLCAALALKAEYTWGTQLRPFNLLLGLTAVSNAGFVFVSWSSLYFGIKYYDAAEAEERRLLASRNAVRDAELRALRYQVHPHFLFNTLNAISTLVVEGERDAAASMITRLADFFRATLEEDASEEVPFQDELSLTGQYLEIEKVRMGDRLKAEIAVDRDLLKCQVPHLLLQPLVENAIRHGIAPRKGTGLMEIHANTQADQLIIHVIDDGLGKLSRDSNSGSRGIGLTNIRKRLQELYGDGGSLELKWPEAGGCHAVATVPFIVPGERSTNEL